MDASLRNTPFRMTKLKVSFQALFRVIPSVSEESSAWMLRFVQHDKGSVIPNASEESTYGCFASLSMTNRGVWMLRFAQHDQLEG